MAAQRSSKNPGGSARELGRREWLSMAAGGALAGSALTRRASAAHCWQSPQGTGRRLVLINLQGAYDSLSMLHPYGESGMSAQSAAFQSYRAKRPLLGWDAGMSPTLPVAGHPELRWHPSCGVLRREFDNQDLAVIQKVGIPNFQLSHFESRDIMSLGRADLSLTPDRRGWLGRLSDAGLGNRYAILGVGVDPRIDFVSNGPSPVQVRRLSGYRSRLSGTTIDQLLRRDVLRRVVAQDVPGSRMGDEVLRRTVPASLDGAEALEAAVAGVTLSGNYPATSDEFLSGSLQDIARLIRTTIGTSIYYTFSDGFDTHGGQEGTGLAFVRPTLSERLDLVMASLDAFITDLKAAPSIWNDTMIVIFTEFGRRNAENQTRGTDHGRGFDAFVLGGGVSGGLKGRPLSAPDIDAENLPVEIDFRTVFRKALQEWLQLSPAIVNGVFNDYMPRPNEPGFSLV